MRYRSTRGQSSNVTFEEAVLMGLAPDGGLFIPHSIPRIPLETLASWSSLSFQALALEIFSLFIEEEEIPRADLAKLIEKSYATFRDSRVTPLKNLASRKYVLELFHGPTFAFKDVALQFLGNLFEYFLERKNAQEHSTQHRITVVGATSGDTGSAAIYGLRNKRNVSVFILHPHGRVSPIQEAQMTTVLDHNVHNLAVEGTFDDCQAVVKELFADKQFNEKYCLGAVNSINWARILAQTVYYFYAYFSLLRSLDIRVDSPEAERLCVRFSVPTGNFGDILAGFYAKQMGLPIDRLTIATNRNDILDRFFATGRYEIIVSEDGRGGVFETLSPAMDIVVSSNFERLLWYLARENLSDGQQGDRDATASKVLAGWMTELKARWCVDIGEKIVKIAEQWGFESSRVDDEQTLQVIQEYFHPEGTQHEAYLMDPHTAVGVCAGMRVSEKDASDNWHTICLATAHPAKFSEAVTKALRNFSDFSFDSILPQEFVGMLDRERRVINVEKADRELVKKVIVQELEKELA
ncbi:uncharacterized protein VTP21DRAFT_3806 [Calcarisporiella thermophila]|uniref:uncharacterized protein n=1 Tax=Calcarisporiella thermophila TaxID=911321 RepID=UPI00374430BB